MIFCRNDFCSLSRICDLFVAFLRACVCLRVPFFRLCSVGLGNMADGC